VNAPLRKLSARPELVIGSPAPDLVDDVVTQSDVGIAGPFGRARVVEALPLNKAGGPLLLKAAQVMHDAALCYLADPSGNLIGFDAVWVHRLLSATKTSDTRRL
jgi:hypothetical protein